MSTVDATQRAGQPDFAEKLLKDTSIRVSDSYLDAFRSHVDPVHHEAGTILFRKGDDSHFAILIAEGEIEVYDEESGNVLAIAGEGSLIGELGLISGDPRSASARTLTPLRGWTIDRAQYREFLSDRPELATLFFRKIYAQLSASYGKLRQQFVALEEADRRYHALAFLFVTMVLMINIYALVNSLILTNLKVTHQSQVMFWTSRVMEVWGAFVIWGLTVRCGLTRHDMGIRMGNLWKSIGMALAISAVALAAMAYFRIMLYPELQGTPILDPKLVTITVYTYIVVAPLQEWICRGVLLTAIADLMPGKTRPMSAIVITSLIFSTLHLHYSQSLAVV
ncbi:MAG: cyclic nucleotide-binding domain-containing protein, partial [Allorhizobium sp.]